MKKKPAQKTPAVGKALPKVAIIPSPSLAEEPAEAVSGDEDAVVYSRMAGLDFKEQNGLLRYFWHHLAGDEKTYNPQRLSVRGIWLELDEAFFNTGDTRRLLHHVLDAEALDESLFCRGGRPTTQENPEESATKKQPETGKEKRTLPEVTAKPLDIRGTNAKMQTLKARMAVKGVSFRTKIYEKYFNSHPTPSHLIQEHDAELADLIHAAPEALLRSYQAQDAYARWTYAVAFCPDPDTRKKAKEYLTTSVAVVRGTPKKANPNLPQLRLAYDDLCAYCRCVLKAADRVPTAEAIEKLFPEVRELEPHGLVLADVLNPRYTKPAPSEIAFSYIAAFCGLSVSRVTDLISEARHSQA